MSRYFPSVLMNSILAIFQGSSQKSENKLQEQDIWVKVSGSSSQKEQRSLSLIFILNKKEFVGKR